MDTEKIQKICDEYLVYYESEEYFEDNDWDTWIFETVLKAIFGDDWNALKNLQSIVMQLESPDSIVKSFAKGFSQRWSTVIAMP